MKKTTNTASTEIMEKIAVEHDIAGVLGEYTTDVTINIRELAQNAVGAIKLATAENPLFIGRLQMWTEVRPDGTTHFMVANNGAETDYNTVLRIGKSSHLTSDHQRGTGFKTAVLGLNKTDEPNSWKLFLKRNGHWTKTTAPYPMDEIMVMRCSEDELARIPEWAVVCIDVLLENPDVLNSITAEKLGYQFAWSQTLRKVHMTYCGQVIEPIMPSGTVKYTVDRIVDVMGVPHRINCLVVDAKTADPADAFFANGEHTQGLHLYANGFFMNHYGMGLFKKKHLKRNTPFNEMFIKPVHPELNRIQISLNIDTPEDHSLELPVNNFKSDAKWNSKVGMAYIDAINNLVICYRNAEDTLSSVQDEDFPIPVTLADYVRLSKRAFKEAGHRQTLEATFNDIEEGNFHMFPECSCSAADIKGNECSRADLLLVKEVDAKGNPILSTTTTTIEYKAGAITPVRISNAIAYYELLAMNYGADPCIRLYGSGITAEAKRFAAHMVKKGYRIKCIHWKDRTPLWARDMWED